MEEHTLKNCPVECKLYLTFTLPAFYLPFLKKVLYWIKLGCTYKKHYSTVSHGVLRIVAATAVMILPYRVDSLSVGITNVLFILGGAAISFGLSCVCNKVEVA